MILHGRRSSPAAALLRIRHRPRPVTAERCEMCAEPVRPDHSHVVNLDTRALMCSCRPCYLLFGDQDAELRYRAVPERYLRFDDLILDQRTWDELQIPVGLAFIFRNSRLGRAIAFYPGPAGATESELPLDTWDTLVAANPELAALHADVEALLIRRSDRPGASTCHLVPIDACYELVGRLRTLWRGFDGGRQAHDAIDAFFARVGERSTGVDLVGPS
ncbi:DUF5947 family protein [Streptomyces sp. NBC_01190]|uniref:DUF5947 family protein n=1 Tax=Streptomyces sp. NBC_01190 TaxID=2903767 RepID=UPI00386FC0F6|nr:DUF5947 family protein [Streptomyces sp. NBC_01190]